MTGKRGTVDDSRCEICHGPMGDSLTYPRGEGWAHWHCIMNAQQRPNAKDAQ